MGGLRRGGTPREVFIGTAGRRLAEARSAGEEKVVGPLIYEAPGGGDITVRRYRYDRWANLHLDVYIPATGGPHPVLVVVVVFDTKRLRKWLGRPHTDWPVNIGWGAAGAAHGLATVIYDARTPLGSFVRVMRFLDRNAASLGLDTTRLAVHATSSNGLLVSRLLAHPAYAPRIRAASLFHAQLVPTPVRSPRLAAFLTWSPDGTLFQQAGEAFARRALNEGRAVEAVADAPPKNFHSGQPTEEGAAIVRRSLEFVGRHLGAGVTTQS